MRALLLVSGLTIVTMGFVGQSLIYDRDVSYALLQGCLTLGGALVICYVFSIKNFWHGIIGGGVVALLGGCRSWWNFPQWLEGLAHGVEAPSKPVIEAVTAVICTVVIVACVRSLFAEKARRVRDGEG